MEVTMAIPRARPVLGRRRPSGTWTWMSHRSSRGGFTPDPGRDGAHVGRRRIDRLLHHVAQRAGRLHAGPCPGRRSASIDRRSPPTEVHASPVTTPIWSSFSASPYLKRRTPSMPSMIVGRDLDGLDLLLLRILVSALARDPCQFPLEVPHPRLAGVVADHVEKRRVRQAELLVLQTVVLDLLGQEMPLGRSRASRPRYSRRAG